MVETPPKPDFLETTPLRTSPVFWPKTKNEIWTSAIIIVSSLNMMASVRKFTLLLSLLVATGAVAAPQDQYLLEQGVELWNGLRTGMTRDEVESLGLEKKFELVEDCRVELQTRFTDSSLYSITIRSRWTAAYNRCGELVKRSLVAKYGDSFDVSAKTESGLYATRGTYLEEQWLTDKLIISLGYGPDNGRFFYVMYEPRLVREDAELIDIL